VLFRICRNSVFTVFQWSWILRSILYSHQFSFYYFHSDKILKYYFGYYNHQIQLICFILPPHMFWSVSDHLQGPIFYYKSSNKKFVKMLMILYGE
jgi:hypothetical protein